MPPYPYGETVTLLRRGPSSGRDEYGKPIPGPVAEISVDGCVVTPRVQSPVPGGSEQQARDLVVDGLTLYLPYGTTVLTTDQVMARSVLYEVTGDPGEWGRNAFTGMPGPVQVQVDRVTG